MKSVSVLSTKLQQLYNRLYTGKLKSIIRRLGVNNILSKPFWKIAYITSSNTQNCKILGEELKFYTNSYAEFMRFKDLSGEQPILEDFLKSCEREDVFFDIGANVGTYTCFAASTLDAGNVASFEPEPTNAARLRENLELNGLDADIFEIALSDTDGTIDLAIAGTDVGEGEHSIAPDAQTDTIQVRTATVDSLVEDDKIFAPSVVKIDVEGAELSVLRGMKKVLTEYY